MTPYMITITKAAYRSCAVTLAFGTSKEIKESIDPTNPNQPIINPPVYNPQQQHFPTLIFPRFVRFKLILLEANCYFENMFEL